MARGRILGRAGDVGLRYFLYARNRLGDLFYPSLLLLGCSH
jgi:hypothetical protein